MTGETNDFAFHTATICVPHDRGNRACGDGGPLFGSTGEQP